MECWSRSEYFCRFRGGAWGLRVRLFLDGRSLAALSQCLLVSVMSTSALSIGAWIRGILRIRTCLYARAVNYDLATSFFGKYVLLRTGWILGVPRECESYGLLFSAPIRVSISTTCYGRSTRFGTYASPSCIIKGASIR